MPADRQYGAMTESNGSTPHHRDIPDQQGDRPDRHEDVIVTYCVALAGAGRTGDAAELMWPFASKTAPWRVRWKAQL